MSVDRDEAAVREAFDLLDGEGGHTKAGEACPVCDALVAGSESLGRLAEQARAAEQLRGALWDYDGVLETAISELHAQARRRYADTMPGQLDALIGDFVEVAKVTRAKHRRARAALAEGTHNCEHDVVPEHGAGGQGYCLKCGAGPLAGAEGTQTTEEQTA